MPPISRAPAPTDDPLPPDARPADEVPRVDAIKGTVLQVIGDLSEVARLLPGMSTEEADRAALLLSALAAECTEAAGMCRALGTSPERAQ